LTDQSTKGGNLAHLLGIVGSGAIARGLARAAAEHHEVVVWARSEQSAQKAAEKVGGARVVTDLDHLTGCDIVVEAVAEDNEVKCDIHKRLGELLPAETILATTTSSLSVAEIANASGRPERFAALHVFNPVTKMALVELAFPPQAGEETKARSHALCAALGKTAVDVSDTPGFVVNRLLFPYLFDAVELLERTGMEPKAVDTCMKLGAGHPLGPLALLDLVGLDVSKAIGETIGARIPATVERLIADGALGRKSGRGFHTYET
jgi:3-hydroxybutyryl-CoA dehydrogenase